jgi:hypothetical protein
LWSGVFATQKILITISLSTSYCVEKSRTGGTGEVREVSQSYRWLSKITVGFPKLPLAFQNYHWLSKITVGFPKLPLAFQNYRWLSKITVGFPKLPLAFLFNLYNSFFFSQK